MMSIKNFDPIGKYVKEPFHGVIQKGGFPRRMPRFVVWFFLIGGMFMIVKNIIIWRWLLLEGPKFERVSTWLVYGQGIVTNILLLFWFAIIIGSMWKLREERNLFFFLALSFVPDYLSRIFRDLHMFPIALVFSFFAIGISLLIINNCINILNFQESEDLSSSTEIK